MDAREREKNHPRGSVEQARTLMNLQNNEAGRMVSNGEHTPRRFIQYLIGHFSMNLIVLFRAKVLFCFLVKVRVSMAVEENLARVGQLLL